MFTEEISVHDFREEGIWVCGQAPGHSDHLHISYIWNTLKHKYLNRTKTDTMSHVQDWL